MMTESQIAPTLVSLAVLLATAHLLDYAAAGLRQPKFVGEILAGVLLGPAVLGWLDPESTRPGLGEPGVAEAATNTVLGFASWLGLLLLMFISGSEVRRVLADEQRRPTAWLLGLGTAVPFAIAFVIGSVLPTEQLRGPNGGEIAFLIVLATAAAVTSVPVISRIFHDLQILHTRFASLVLGTAMLEDIVLFAALAVATALPRPGDSPLDGELAMHIAVTLAYFVAGLVVAPSLLRALQRQRWNVLAQHAQIAYALILMLAYTAIAAMLDVNVVFGAFLAGFGLVGGLRGTERTRWTDPLGALGRVAFATVVPLYFVIVGARLQFDAGFSIVLLLIFLVASSALRMTFVGTASLASGFGRRDSAELAVAMNARGGPGILLATIALDAGIIAGPFFTALVLTAVITSQLAGWWLSRTVVQRGQLLGERIKPAVQAGSLD